MTTPSSLSLLSPPNDQRVFRRYKITIMAVARPASEQENVAHPVLIKDMSATGILFTAQAAYPVGSFVEIQVDLGQGEKASQVYTFTAIVRRMETARVQDSVVHKYGVDFVRSRSLNSARYAIADFLCGQPLPAASTDWAGDRTDDALRLLAAREQEWAEAYVQEHPDCELGRIYLMMTQADTPAPA